MSLVRSNPGSSKTSQGPGQAEWNKHKALITTLYLRERKTVAQIVAIMAQEYNFHATERMFKFRFKTWKLEKSLTPNEALAMARVQARRKTKDKASEFWKHGRPVTACHFERYLKNHPHVVEKLKKHIPEDALMKGHVEALLPPHIVVLTPSQLLKGDQRLYSLENVLLVIRDYIYGYPDEHWDYLRRMAVWDPELQEEGNRRPFSSSCNGLTEETVNAVLDSHFHWLPCEMAKEKPDFIHIVCYYTMVRVDRPEVARMWLTSAWEWSVAFKGPMHPLSVAFSEAINWFSLMEGDSVYKFLDVVYGAYSTTAGEDDETLTDLMEDLSEIMGGLTVTCKSQKYTDSSQLEYLLRKVETELHVKRYLLSACYLVDLVEPYLAKRALRVLDSQQWQEILSGYPRTQLALAFAYWNVGDVQGCFRTCWDLFEDLVGYWKQHGVLSPDLEHERGNLNILGCLCKTLDDLPDDLEDIQSLRDQTQELRRFVHDSIADAMSHRPPLQLYD